MSDTTSTLDSSTLVAAAMPSGSRRMGQEGTFAGRRQVLLRATLGIGIFVIGCASGLLWDKHQQNAAVVSVNGTAITRQALTHRLEIAAGAQVLQQMIKEEMQLQFARKLNVLPGDSDVESKYMEASKQPNFAQSMFNSHQTPEDLRRGIQVNLAQAAVLHRGVTVTNEEIQAFYKSNTDKKNASARYYRPEAVQIAAIITDNAAQLQQATHDLASGQSFAQVAAKYSKDQSKKDGGLLPAIRRGQIDQKKFPGLDDTLFGMTVGQQIDSVKVAGAYWLIRCVGTSKEATVPFDKVKEECRLGAMLAKGIATQGKSTQTDAAAFEKAADIKILDLSYKAPDTK